MKSLLESVIDAYLSFEPAELLADCCFVFPNKRTGVFFHNIINEKFAAAGRKGLHPASMPVNEFIASLADGMQADRLESMFILYTAYRHVVENLSGKNARVDFNKFQRWGDVLMSDFNDVDMSLVDPAELFPNLESLREISANYLTEAQIEAIRRHWDEERIPAEVSDFWNHVTRTLREPGKKPSAEFIKLWQVMEPVYEEYRRLLSRKGLYYMGMAYREVASRLQGMTAGELPFRRYVFVGFSLLTPVEKKIFAILRDKYTPDNSPIADFYWDNASPAFDMPGNTGAFINRMAVEFPSLHPCVAKLERFPRISIIGVPSRVGQAKLAGEIITGLYPLTVPEGATEAERAEMLRSTAVVFPDESLAIPTLRSIPPHIDPVNLTMGYRLRQSSTATFVSAVTRMQIRGRISARDGVEKFLAEDVLQVLSHPIIHQGAQRAAMTATLEIRLKRSFTVDAGFFQREELRELAQVFSFVRNSADPDAVLSYLYTLMQWTLEAMRVSGTGAGSPTDIPEEELELYDLDGTPLAPAGEASPRVVDLAIAQRYFDAIEHLRHLSGEYLGMERIYLADTTVFQMIEHLVAGETMSFQGQPLRGLQLMGVLEARALDFDNIIIPSLNEKIFPRRHYQKSLIPPVLRKAYGMITAEHQEALYSYYFYRMIARARRVWLIYDARRGAPHGGGQMSRYLHQLIRLYRPDGLQRRLHGYPVLAPSVPGVTVEKTPEVMEKVRRYFSEENPLYLSASSINEYINCPLSFYIKNIEGYNREDTVREWIDESVFGTVMHQALQNLYDDMAAANPGRMITREAIERVLADPHTIESPVVTAINEHHHNLGKMNTTPLRGSSLIVGQLIAQYIRGTLRRETELTPFEYIAGEKVIHHRITLTDNDPDTGEERDSLSFNLKAIIDRIDRVAHPEKPGERLLRIVDYKTGADPTDARSVKALFEHPQNQRAARPKAMLQLLLYSQVLQEHCGSDEPVQPLIYSLRQVSTKSFSPLKIGGEEVYDHRGYAGEMSRYLIPVLKELADEKIPFRNTSDIRACHYCKFQGICARKAENL